MTLAPFPCSFPPTDSLHRKQASLSMSVELTIDQEYWQRCTFQLLLLAICAVRKTLYGASERVSLATGVRNTTDQPMLDTMAVGHRPYTHSYGAPMKPDWARRPSPSSHYHTFSDAGCSGLASARSPTSMGSSSALIPLPWTTFVDDAAQTTQKHAQIS